MQRIGPLVVGLLTLGAARAGGQQATGTTLWRVAGTTLATPPALALGPAAAIWNPAQTEGRSMSAPAGPSAVTDCGSPPPRTSSHPSRRMIQPRTCTRGSRDECGVAR